jgi:hypothetical protein
VAQREGFLEGHLAVDGLTDDWELVGGLAADGAEARVQACKEDAVKDCVCACLAQTRGNELVGRAYDGADELGKDENNVQVHGLWRRGRGG